MRKVAVLAAVLVSFLLPGCVSGQISTQLNRLDSVALADAQHAAEIASAVDDQVGKICYDRIAKIAGVLQEAHQGAQGVLVNLEIARLISRDRAIPDCKALLAGFSVQF
jgi:outer membrane murein-binding lipoprotein Lpp